MKLRARLAVVLTFLLMLLGLSVAAQADTPPEDSGTSTNGCVVVPPLELAACLARF